MVTTKDIEQKILAIDPTKFQRLGDSYLKYTRGIDISLMSLGTQEGADKPTKGTPDTYYKLENGKYVFVEYTTQQSQIFSKLKGDVEKCLDESVIKIKRYLIDEIILMHTSSNITVAQDQELSNMCQRCGIKLTIIGINKLAGDIFQSYPRLAREYLDMSIDTEQIQLVDDFIEDYNLNKWVAPIDTEFLFREKEINEIRNAFEESDVVILNGAAGNGKTRLALHYIEKYRDIDEEKIYCISNKDLDIYEDLVNYLSSPGSYFLFIDDANQLTNLKYIFRCLETKTEGFSFKVLITVRNYALKKVIDAVEQFASFAKVDVNKFSNDEVEAILEQSFNIKNSLYRKRIMRVAEGNARLAVLAAKVAIEENTLAAINDVSQLYRVYFGKYLQDELQDDEMWITAGIIAFLEKIHLDYKESLLIILQENGLTIDEFTRNYIKLHESEIVDIYADKVICFSDQCLSNFFLKHAIIDKKSIDLSKLIRNCFPKYPEKTIYAIDTLLNVFGNSEVQTFVSKAIEEVWNELESEKSPMFFEYLKAFYSFKPTETLYILKKIMDSNKEDMAEGDVYEWIKGKDLNTEIIRILSGYTHMEEFETACELFFYYFSRRPDLYDEFKAAAKANFSVDLTFILSKASNCDTQIIFFEKLIKFSDDWNNELFVRYFFDLAGDFLKFHFYQFEQGRNKIIKYDVNLILSDGVGKYRELIWKSLYSLAGNSKYKGKVRNILHSYGGYIGDNAIPIMEFDLHYIQNILRSYFPSDLLENCLLANHLRIVFKEKGLTFEDLLSDYLEEEKFRLFQILYGPDYDDEFDLNKREELKVKIIKEYICECDLEGIKRLADIYKEALRYYGVNSFEIDSGFALALKEVSNNKDFCVDVIKYCLEQGATIQLEPTFLINMLFSQLPEQEVYQIITNSEYEQKNDLLYAYYRELPSDAINEKHLEGLYAFLKDSSDCQLPKISMRDLDFLEKYQQIDKQVYFNGCEIILSKMQNSQKIGHVYFQNLFNVSIHDPKDKVLKFKTNFDLLKRIYFSMLSIDGNFDYQGEFLREMYRTKPSILEEYIGYLSNEKILNKNQKRILCFFELDNFSELYDKIFDQLIQNTNIRESRIALFLENIILYENPKRDHWIRHCIQVFNKDEIKMKCLFSAISKLDLRKRKEYMLLFLEYNSSFEHFKRLPTLVLKEWSWQGSELPILYEIIAFLKLLLPRLNGIDWLDHQKYINELIAKFEKDIKEIKIQEFITA